MNAPRINIHDVKESSQMDRNAAENLRRALAAGDLTGGQVLNLLVEVRAGMEARLAEEAGTVHVDAADVAELAAELRAASVAIGRAAALIERIVPSQDPITESARADAATLRACYPGGLPRRDTYRTISRRFGWGMSKTTNAIKAYRAQVTGVFAGRERVS